MFRDVIAVFAFYLESPEHCGVLQVLYADGPRPVRLVLVGELHHLLGPLLGHHERRLAHGGRVVDAALGGGRCSWYLGTDQLLIH